MQRIVAERIGTEADRLINRLRSRELESLGDAEQCTALWLAVIKRAVDDLEWLNCMQGRARLWKHQMEELRRIHESPPAEFLHGQWFDQICGYLDLDPALVRKERIARCSKLLSGASAKCPRAPQ